jgi:SAM-dependent methyltransferase
VSESTTALDGGDDASSTPATPSRSGPLSWYARWRKLDYFLPRVPKDARLLDVGCAGNWFKRKAADRGWTDVVGLDVLPTADIVGDVRDWRQLGLEPHSFDAIVAFELVEHGDFTQSFHDLLKPEGLLLVTTPLPAMDPMCLRLEKLGMLQKRGSPHTHLTDLRDIPQFEVVERRVRAFISQWGVLRPR